MNFFNNFLCDIIDELGIPFVHGPVNFTYLGSEWADLFSQFLDYELKLTLLTLWSYLVTYQIFLLDIL